MTTTPPKNTQTLENSLTGEPNRAWINSDPSSSPDPTKLYAKLAEVMASVDRIPKNGYNDFHNYAYATESDVSEGLRSALADRKVTVLVSGKLMQVRPGKTPKGKDTFFTDVQVNVVFACGDSGATVEVTMPGTGDDPSDKGTYKAITGAVKYLLMKTFLIPTGDDPDQAAEHQAPAQRSGGSSGGRSSSGGGRRSSKPVTIPWGQHKGKPPSEVEDDYLKWMLGEKDGKLMLDPDDAKYGRANQRLRQAIEAELDRRKQGDNGGVNVDDLPETSDFQADPRPADAQDDDIPF